MYKINLIFAFLAFLLHVCNADLSDPSAPMMNSAYCACKCCDPLPELCYMHPAIKDLECETDLCTEEFCIQYRAAKCESSCFCRKCKHELPKGDYKCAKMTQIPEGCHCPDMDSIKCPKKAAEEPSEEDEAARQVSQYTDNFNCMLSCFCSKCIDAAHFSASCSEVAPPPKECDCSKAACPTKKEMDRLHEISLQAQELEGEAATVAWKRNMIQLKEEAARLNENLKPAIDSGKIEPISPSQVKSSKCKLQCLCNKCRKDSPQMDARCNEILKEKEKFCPKCSEDIQCPAVDDQAQCKMLCFCDVCRYDERMLDVLRKECERIIDQNTADCQCKDREVDCSVLDQLGETRKVMQEEAAKQIRKANAKQGKLKKKKTKVWDEL